MMTIKASKKILAITTLLIVMLGTMTTVFADESDPVVNFTDSGVIFNKDVKLLRFNLKWNHPDDKAVDIMYSIDDSKAIKLGSYDNQDDQVIAHIYLENEQLDGNVLNIYAVDENGNESIVISSEFQSTSASGITISDEQVPLAAPEGTWSLINLFLAALSVAMVAVSAMLFFENKSVAEFKNCGKLKSTFITVLTLIFAIANVAIMITTQNLKHQMVMVDNMTLAMLILTILGIITTMVLAVRAFNSQALRDMKMESN